IPQTQMARLPVPTSAGPAQPAAASPRKLSRQRVRRDLLEQSHPIGRVASRGTECIQSPRLSSPLPPLRPFLHSSCRRPYAARTAATRASPRLRVWAFRSELPVMFPPAAPPVRPRPRPEPSPPEFPQPAPDSSFPPLASGAVYRVPPSRSRLFPHPATR